MTNVSSRKLAETSDWAGSPLSTLHRLTPLPQPIPIEQYCEADCHVVRLEVPGVDPSRDLNVSVAAGTLSVEAKRHDDVPDQRQSEFRYGSFAQRIPLPADANVHAVSASCRNGILTVRIGRKAESRQGPQVIHVQVKPT